MVEYCWHIKVEFGNGSSKLELDQYAQDPLTALRNALDYHKVDIDCMLSKVEITKTEG
jgi:hypothetical protein